MNKVLSRQITLLALALSALFLYARPTPATEISGPISSTLTISDDSELVGDVTCTVSGGPCIAFGASDIKLRLNGFTISGPDVPPGGCTQATSSDDGIDVVGQNDVAIIGPGLVEKFGGFGIFLLQDSKVRIERTTMSDNCFSGVILIATTDSDIVRNVSVRNSLGSEGAPCGGT